MVEHQPERPPWAVSSFNEMRNHKNYTLTFVAD